MRDGVDLAAPKRLRRSRRCVEFCTLEDVPDFLRDNDFILLGYRPQLSAWGAAKSIFAVHNETTNIWTHLLGSLAMLILAALTVPYDAWPIYVFDAGAFSCLTISWLAHAFCCIGPVAYSRAWRMDHGTIVVLQMSEFVPFSVYMFDGLASIVYLSCALVIGICALMLSSMPKFQTPAWRKYRTVCFAAVGSFGIVPLLHASIVSDWRVSGVALGLTFGNLAFMALGAILFAARIPERWVRGTCLDYMGSSHNLLHVCIVCGFVMYHFACIRMLEL